MPDSNTHIHDFNRRLLLMCIMGCIFHALIAGICSIPPQSDALDYHEHALRLAETHDYTVNGIPTAYRPIGFPAALSIAYMISPHIISGFILQSLLVSITAYCIGLILVECGVSKKKSLFASGIYLLLPMTWLQSMTLMSEPLAICAMMLSINIRFTYHSHLARGLEGLLWGIAILARPVMVFCVIGIVIHDLLSKSRSFAQIGIYLTCTLLTLMPWVIRNANIMGSPVIASNTGINLYIGNNAHANGSYKVMPDMNVFDSLPEMQANALGISKAIAYVTENPLQSLIMIPKKIAYLFSSDAYLPLQLFQTDAMSYRDRLMQLPAWTIVLLIPGCILMFFGMSYVSIFRSIHQQSHIFVILFCMILPCMIFFGSARYHEPMIPFMLIAAVSGYERNGNFIGPMKVLPIALALLWSIEFVMIFLHM